MKLKPCPNPFCEDSIPTITKVGEFDEYIFSVECEFCGTYTGQFLSEEGAIEFWNHRPLEDQLKAHAVEVVAIRLGYIHEFAVRTNVPSSIEDFKESWDLCNNQAWQDFRMEMRAEARALLGWEE